MVGTWIASHGSHPQHFFSQVGGFDPILLPFSISSTSVFLLGFNIDLLELCSAACVLVVPADTNILIRFSGLTKLFRLSNSHYYKSLICLKGKKQLMFQPNLVL